MAQNRVAADWQLTLAGELNNNMLMNTPKGRTAYACGAAFVVEVLREDFTRETLERLVDELRAFVDDYMRVRTD